MQTYGEAMNTQNIEELIGRLREGFNHGDSANVLKVADAMQSQAERIKVLELDLDVQAGSIEAVKGVNARQAERIRVIERESEMRRIALHEAMLEADTLRAAPVAIVDTRDALGLCAPAEEDFNALYALQGRRVALVDLGPNAVVSGG